MIKFKWDKVEQVMRPMPLTLAEQDKYLRWLVSRPPIIRINKSFRPPIIRINKSFRTN